MRWPISDTVVSRTGPIMNASRRDLTNCKYYAGVVKYMPRMTIISRDGEERRIEGKIGLSLMENIREAGFDEMLALCGGCCSCATCHVQIDPGTIDGLPDMSEDESDLLDSSVYRTADSRLSCQIIFEEQTDGIRLKIAPED